MSTTYDIGDTARLYLSLTDVNGVAANGTVVLTVTSPTGVTSTPTVVNDSTGEYHADVDLDTYGRWPYKWRSTGAVKAAEEGFVEVRTTRALATVDDVAGRWRTLTAAEQSLAAVLIDDTEQILRSVVTTIDDSLTAGTLDAGLVAAVIARTVIRAMRNPSAGMESRTVSIDDYSATERYTAAHDDLYISDADLALLTQTELPTLGRRVRSLSLGY